MVARLPAGSLPAPPARGTEGHGLFPGAHPVRSEALPRGRALSQMKSLSARLVFSPRARPSGSSFPLRVPPSVSSCPLRPAAVSHRAHSPLQGCVNLCCNASTCTLKPDAVCAHGLCCQDCQVSVLGPRPAPGSAGSSLGQATGHLGCENGGPDRTSWCPPPPPLTVTLAHMRATSAGMSYLLVGRKQRSQKNSGSVLNVPAVPLEVRDVPSNGTSWGAGPDPCHSTPA